MLNLTVDSANEVVILKCRGRIVHGQETRILCAALPYYGREIVLDLGEIAAIDAAGIGALVALQAAGIYLKVANPTKQVSEVLRLTKLDSIIEICNPCPPSNVADDRVMVAAC